MKSYKEITDTELIFRFSSNDQQAFNEIFNRYWKLLYKYTFNILNDNALTEDCLQEVFTNVWVRRNELEINNLKNYLFSSVRFRAISRIRQAKFTSFNEEIIDSLVVDEEILYEVEELEETIKAAADQLTDRCKEIFLRSRFQHQSNKEIAESLNISIRTVENQLSIALKHIRNVLQNSGSLAILLLFYL
ncbi:RNA polymerase sigma factor [Chondrinema litorale]|uniref:RNA polymerase sigma factor n=1 Tax=Chondrinema litorale TaxID=2994555 RepID=UPI00254288A1|nr:RNA polymerase sigma-70 factor [Chondrinema litorale]UZR96724.1 RNA polymerase sigma-70 factor [Chondrinema litorale]